MSAYLSPVLNEPQPDANGNPLVGGLIHTYLAGSSTPAPTYTSSSGLVAQANPIVLNARGVVDNPVWLTGGTAYKFVLTDVNGVSVNPGFDNVQGINDPASFTAPDQWVSFGGAPTFLSTTSFSLTGDQTGTFEVGRRVKAQCSGGTVYCTVTASSFGAGVTTVTVAPDTVLTLDSGLSAVSYGLLSYTNKSVPWQAGELLGVRVITVTGAYTPTAGTSKVFVRLVGGGAGGGGATGTGAGQNAVGGGGGAGGWADSFLSTGFSGVTVTIGAAGTGGTAGSAGANGGTTSFGAVFNATGGTGGANGTVVSTGTVAFTLGGAGGVGSSGNVANGNGQAGLNSLYASATGISGAGGASVFGGGAASVTGNSTGGTAASPGAGGSGGSLGASAPSGATGGTGANGRCIVWEYA